MPADNIFDIKVQELQKEWDEWGSKILAEIASISRLQWHEKEIIVYLTGGVRPYSDPLTLNLRSTIDTLTHELIHRILTEPENWRLFKNSWEELMQKYSQEPEKTRTHVIVHAIHTPILKNLFGEERYQKERNSMTSPDYVRAWEIVDRDGYEDIIKELTAELN